MCAFVGYSPSHAGDCYRMWNPVKKSIHITRDIRWLKRMYYAAKDEPFKDEDDLQLVFNSSTLKDGKGNDAVTSNEKMNTIIEIESDESCTDESNEELSL